MYSKYPEIIMELANSHGGKLENIKSQLSNYQKARVKNSNTGYLRIFDLDDLPYDNDNLIQLELDKFDGVRISAENIVKPEYLSILRIISELGLAISCLGEWPQFYSESFIRIAQENPELNIVLEHLAGIGHNSHYQKEYCEKIKQFSNHKNIYIKITGVPL